MHWLFGMVARVLIVEDEAVLRKHLVRLFAREGYEVATAASCTEALEQLRCARFEVLLLDVMLPDGNGLDLLADLHAHQRPHTIVVTACSAADNAHRICQLNIGHVLHKPVDLLQIIGAVRLATPEPGRIPQLWSSTEEMARAIG